MMGTYNHRECLVDSQNPTLSKLSMCVVLSIRYVETLRQMNRPENSLLAKVVAASSLHTETPLPSRYESEE
jgi:hypothetical protein